MIGHTYSQSYAVVIYMAGDIDTAKRFLREKCYETGLCVTVTPTTFIYTGGEEQGLAIGFINYPRFPEDTPDIFVKAMRIAESLVVTLCQKSALVWAVDRTVRVHIDPPGARQ